MWRLLLIPILLNIAVAVPSQELNERVIRESTATGVIKGDPHVTTFDQKAYTFAGNVGRVYTVATNKADENRKFEITLKKRGGRTDSPNVIDKVCIADDEGYDVSVEQGGSVGHDITFTYIGQVNGNNQGGSIGGGHGAYTLTVTIPTTFNGKVDGLLGNYDGNKENEGDAELWSRPDHGWPCFSLLWTNYPRGDDTKAVIKDVCKLSKHKWLWDDPDINTCAIRASYSMIASGHNLNDITQEQCNTWKKVKNSDGDSYIIRVATMVCYLDKYVSTADIISTKKNDYKDKTGIIVFQKCSNFGAATGHVDLWNGNACARACHWNKCNDIRLYEI